MDAAATTLTAARRKQPPLVLHIVYRFDIGGLENGVVNLINHMPAGAYRHAVLALTEAPVEFQRRIRRENVPVIALNKPPGHGIWLYPKLYKLFRELRPDVVHTRNLAALEAVVPAWAARVPGRVHSEHGFEGRDLGATSPYDRVRRLYRPFVSHYVALSADLARYLAAGVGVKGDRLTQVYNGVDSEKFTPAAGGPASILGCPFSPSAHWLVGTVGRMHEVKDQPTLARAFVRALELQPALRSRLRLVMVGDGPLKASVMEILRKGGADELSWLPGERSDVADVMRGLHCFALPSRSEGISNVILEAMASGLPILATAVGGNPELLSDGRTAELVPPSDPEAMAQALVRLATDPERAAAMGQAARADVEARFSMRAMVQAYQGLYDGVLRGARAH